METQVYKKALIGGYEGNRIEIETPKGKIVVGETDYGDEQEAKRKAMKQEYNSRTQEFIGTFDIVGHREYLILFSIIEAPFEIKIENLRRVDKKTGKKIEEAYTKLNEVSDKEGE